MKNISDHFLRVEEPKNGPWSRDTMPKPNQRCIGKILYLPKDPVTKYTELSSEHQLKTLTEPPVKSSISWHWLPTTFLDQDFEHGGHGVRRSYLNSLEGLRRLDSTKQCGSCRRHPRYIQLPSFLVIFLC